jgi:LPS export ABC transporter protein LptC/lipopolysaccharide transport protein LptA
MRLKRILIHRILRFLRAVLPVLVLGLVAIPAWNYYGRLALKNVSTKAGPKLPSGVSVRTEGFTYSVTDGQRTRYVVHARQSLGFQDQKYVLRDVDVTVYGMTDKDPQRKIRGQNCTYDQGTNDFACTGNVEVELDEKTLVRTDNLIYNHSAGTVTAPKRARIEQTGTTATSDRFEYGMMTGLLKLDGSVHIQTADRVEIQTNSALYQQKENWATMSGGVQMQSPKGWIRGLSGRADLDPVTHKPKLITIDGNVVGESHPEPGREAYKLRAGWMQTTISAAGTAERVQSRDNVEIEKIAGDTTQRLNGGEVDTKLTDGKVDVLEAHQNARMVMGADQTLESAQIWTNATGSVQTKENSVLKVGDSTIQGTEFNIENRDDIVTFSTLRHATLKKEGGQESSSDQTKARFDSHTNMLMELVQSGNFKFRTPQYEGHAQTGRFEDGGTVVTLEGSPVVTDSQKRLEASQVRINQKDNTFVATKNVSTVMKNNPTSAGKSTPSAPEDQVLVRAGRAEGGSDSIMYTGNVQLWRGDAYIKSERLNAAGQPGQKGKLHAEAAQGGKVQSNLKNVRATSDTLDYDDTLDVIRYRGHVRAQKQDMILEAPSVDVNFRDNNVTEMVASGGVNVTRADQRGTGERVVWDAATDVVTLTGKDAQVRDKENGLVQGSTLTIKNKGQTASVESSNGERTTTKHPVKNEPPRK